MSDLRVDYRLLEETERNLSSLRSEFRSVETRMGAYDSALGSPDIAGAIREFSADWDHRRGRILANIENLGQFVSAARRRFRETDENLKNDLPGN